MNGPYIRALVVAICLIDLSCSRPTAPSPVVPSVLAPTPISPASGALIGDLEQPVTLVVQNPTQSPQSQLADLIEISNDSAFGSIIIRMQLGPITSDRSSLTLDRLAANTAYYWRVRASADGASSVSQVATFRIGPAIASGLYEMAIDGSSTACGGSFNQRITLDGDLVRGPDGLGKDGFDFGRTTLPCGVCFLNYDYIGMRVNFATSALVGHILFMDVRANSPQGVYVNPASLTDLTVSGMVNPDGTMTGTMTGTLFLLNDNLPSASKETCDRATFAWTLAPR